MEHAIAIVGMACVYPDARSPVELWENALAHRRAFRRIPPERLSLKDYYSSDTDASDQIYIREAAVIEGYEFDRARFCVAGQAFRSADATHWLALDVAAQALADAGFPDGKGLPREMTGVFLGNTLTGEFSRSNTLRLRWPYVRRAARAALAGENWPEAKMDLFLESFEEEFKSPFPPIGEESLAGGLSNTIAGRICNHFDMKGGGYTVDGACASSLLAVTTACSAIEAGDVKVALAGGVDLSLDPFELVGFARSMALSRGEMRVYDAHSSGFLPGEGSGMIVLMPYADAVAQGRRSYAVIRGWGISSDGSGGLTRPDVEGQVLALRRAYRRAGFGMDTVPYFEGHGTGTRVGDATELQALSTALREAGADSPAAISSIKANIGHTKAAAGAAGLIKAAMAVHNGILPPATGCDDPHPELTRDEPALRALTRGAQWPSDAPSRAGVSAMGFGGINAHVVLEGEPAAPRRSLTSREIALLNSAQDAELFLLDASDKDALLSQVDRLSEFASKLSRSELTDLAARLERGLGSHAVRAAIVASTPAQLASGLEKLRACLIEGAVKRIDIFSGVFFCADGSDPRIAFLFPGQGSPTHADGGYLRRRFRCVDDLYNRISLSAGGDARSTEYAQPVIVTACAAGLKALDLLGVSASLAIGHSLGELAALYWADSIGIESLLRIATVRGRAMAAFGSSTGAMASVMAGHREVQESINGQKVVIAAVNSPHHTVISGEARDVEIVLDRMRKKAAKVVRLPVSRAFHSPLVAQVVPVLSEHLSTERIEPPGRRVISTVNGALLSPDEDIRSLLCRQVTSPVRFLEAVTAVSNAVDLLIEVGPGSILSEMVSKFIDAPAVSIDAGGPSLKGLLRAVGAAFVLGQNIDHAALFNDRFTRPFDLDWRPRFFSNPCELSSLAPPGSPNVAIDKDTDEGELETRPGDRRPVSWERVQAPPVDSSDKSPLGIIKNLVAQRTELPLSSINDDDRLLSNLHLNSITVSQMIVEAAREMGLKAFVSPLEFSDASIAEIAEALRNFAALDSSSATVEDRAVSGVDSWVRPFVLEMAESPLPRREILTGDGKWEVTAIDENPLAEPLQNALDAWGKGGGLVVCLPAVIDERHLDLLLDSVRAHLSGDRQGGLVIVQPGASAAPLARTLFLENPGLNVCVVDAPPMAGSVELALEEIKCAAGYTEAHYDAEGVRHKAVLKLIEPDDEPSAFPLDRSDVLLVTGGAKGITAECAMALAKEEGVTLALLGRSEPLADAELAANIERLKAERISFQYYRCDVTDAPAVQSAVAEIEKSLGPVTGILHGAAINVPQLLKSLDRASLARTVDVKVRGLRNVLSAVDAARLKLLVSFGSIIAVTGLPGEAHYGLANEWLGSLTRQFQDEHSHCKCLTVQWSAWSAVGMAERAGRIEMLRRAGITPITPESGIAILRRLLKARLPSTSIVVSGRFGDIPTLELAQPELPLRRFLERPRVHYPGVELIADASLSSEADPYLDDHKVEGRRVLPAVMGLEAMAQVAGALIGSDSVPAFEGAQFTRPIILPDSGGLVVRTCALATGPGRVEVALRSEETAFQVDHFRAVCKFAAPDEEPGRRAITDSSNEKDEARYLPLDPEGDLYGRILFHTGRFRRVLRYRALKSDECLAEVSGSGPTKWFGPYFPPHLILGDPGLRDAAIHAIQACIPHAMILPVGIDRMVTYPADGPAPYLARARERARHGNTFIYDLELSTADGRLMQRWEGLRLKIVKAMRSDGPWNESLLAAYIERRVAELLPGAGVAVAIEAVGDEERKRATDRAIRRALGEDAAILRGANGKPRINGDRHVSASHAGRLTLAVAGASPQGCDLETVTRRQRCIWRDLLGPERFSLAELIGNETGEDFDTAATRVWAAVESLKKAGAMADAPLTLLDSPGDGWVSLLSGPLVTATYRTSVRGVEPGIVAAVLARVEHEGV